MDPKEQLTPIIKAIQKLKDCYPEDSWQAEHADSLSLALVNMVIGGGKPDENQEVIKEFHSLSGQNAAKRFKAAHARREVDDTLVEALENNALLKTFIQKIKGQ
ncbi:hypothetical protein ES703_52932 [subsurface metagenome]